MLLIGLLTFFTLVLIVVLVRPRWYLKLKAKFHKPIYYDLSDFPEMQDFHNSFNEIRQECQNVLQMPLVELNRDLDVWSNGNAAKADAYFNKHKHIQGWIPGPGVENNQWLNFPLVAVGHEFHNNLKLCPILAKLIKKHKKEINICGFSLLKPGGKLKPHVDTTGMPYGTLAYHLGLIIPKNGENNLIVDGQKIIQKEGQSIVFDSTYLHTAENMSDLDRIILYIDFKC